MDTQERTRFSITFGAEKESNRKALNRFIDSVERELTRNTGGMKRIEHSGSWRTDGNSEAPYTGELTREPAVTLSFVTDVDSERMLSVIKAVVRDEADRQDLLSSEAMRWVNVEMEPVRVSHFDLTEPVGGSYDDSEPYDPGPSARVVENRKGPDDLRHEAPTSSRNESTGPHGY
jgi:hypothetical protein